MVLCKLYLFGTPRIEHRGQPLVISLRKVLALFVYLAVTRQPHSRDALATLFWPEKDQQGARSNLRRTLYDLSQLLGQPLSDQLLAIGPETVSLRLDAPLWIDTGQFQQSLSEFLPPTALPDIATNALLSLTNAAELYAANFLAGFTLPDCPAFAEWQFFQGEELRRAYLRLLQQLALAYTTQGKLEEAIHYTRRWLQQEPLDEAGHRQLMRLYAQTDQQAAALRQYDECMRMLAEELNATPAKETTALYEAIRTKRFPQPDMMPRRQDDKVTPPVNPAHLVIPSSSPPVISTPPHNLPTQTTPFVGRAQEVADILQRIQDPACRLLTLIGPGGIGKTRLALEAAQKILDYPLPLWNLKSKIQNLKFQDGVFFVPLQPVGTPDGIISAIAEATGLRFYGDIAPQQQLLAFLQEKQLLLILDNFEHLLPGVELLAAILKTAPQVKLFVTSREALNLQEEWFHPLAGLSLPALTGAPYDHMSHADRQASDAVQLFVQNAQRARVEFSLAAEEQSVARICRLVDGIPLALELAAAWLKVLSCAEIGDEIEHSLDILTTRQQNIPVRHRSMRAVLEQSWQLLAAPEQAVLAQLAVFHGGFDPKAAQHIAGASLLILASLVEKALIYQTEGRYQIHELLRQFAAEQLAHNPQQAAETEVRHSRYYLDFLQQCADGKQVDLALENIRTGWRFAVAHDGFVWLSGAVDALCRLYSRRALYQEGRNDFALLVERLTALSAAEAWLPLLGVAQRCLGAFYYYLGDYATAGQHFQGALACATAVNAQSERTLALAFLGLVAGWQGKDAESDHLFQQSLALNRSVGDAALQVELFIKIAQLRGQQGRYAESQAFSEESLAASRKLGQAYWIIRALDALGFTMYRLGQHEQAKQYYEEGLRLAEQTNDREGFILTSGGLGLAANKDDREQILAVLPYVERGLQISRQMGQSFYMTSRLVILGALYNRLHQSEQVFTYCQEGVAIARRMGNPYFIVINLHYLGVAARRLGQLTFSRECLRESVAIARKANMASAICDGLYELALTLLALADSPMTATAEMESESVTLKGEALTWLLMVVDDPACDAPTAERAQLLLVQLEAELPAPFAVAAKARSHHSLEEVAAALGFELSLLP